MLLAIILVLSTLFSAGICGLAGAFENYMWAWLLPVCFIGFFLVLLVMWFLLIVIMAKRVDMDEEDTPDGKFYRLVIHWTVSLAVVLLRIHIHAEGFDQPLPEGRFLLVSNHLHDVDPVFLLRYLYRKELVFIGKKEVRDMFLIGPFMKKLQGQFMDRENDREALKTIIKCIQIVKEDKGSVAVFPEGWVSLDRKLHSFRPGVFKIAQKAKVPIVVCTLQDTHKILGKAKKLRRSDICVHMVGVIPAEELEGVTTVDISNRVHDMMARDLGPDLVRQEENT